jgi:hypothetical protein
VAVKHALAVLFVLAVSSIASAETWFKGTLDEALAAAKREKKFVLVDFTQDG